jgi:hypothetical protein
MSKKYNLNASSKFVVPDPNSESSKLDKVMFYFGECHHKYQLNGSKNKILKAKILDTIHTCCQRTAMEFMNAKKKDEGGTERILIKQLCCKPPTAITPDLDKVISVRAGKSRIIGELTGNIFIVFFVDYKLELYDH